MKLSDVWEMAQRDKPECHINFHTRIGKRSVMIRLPSTRSLIHFMRGLHLDDAWNLGIA